MPVATITVEANGLAFAVDEAGSGDHLALCLHGFPESRYSWRFQLPHLASLGYRVWAPDLRGYGQTSPRPEGVDAYHIDRLLEDVAALIDASGAKDVTLLAHDWGAIIAWIFAARKIRPLTRLVIMNVPHPGVFGEVMSQKGPAAKEQRKRSWYVAFFQLPWLPEAMMTGSKARGVRNAFYNMAVDKTNFGPETLDHYAQNALQPGAMTAMINYYRALPRARAMFETTPKVETPTLLVWGEEDTALSIHLVEPHVNWVKDITIERLPGVSHWVQQEAPDKVNRALTLWLSTPRPA